MTVENFLRRSIAAAFASISLSTEMSLYAQTSVNTPTHGGGNSGDSTVVSELNRIFRENGQEPPSMRASDLPNGNVHRVTVPPEQAPSRLDAAGKDRFVSQSRPGQQNQIRSAYSSASGNQTGSGQVTLNGVSGAVSQQSSERPKKNAFQKMIGRIRSGAVFRNSGSQAASSSGEQTGTHDGQGLSSYSAPPPVHPGQPSRGGSRTISPSPAQNRMGTMAAMPGNTSQMPAVPRSGSRMTPDSPRVSPAGNPDLSRTRNGNQLSSVPQVPLRKDVDKFAPIQPAPVAPPSDDFVDPFEDAVSDVAELNETIDLEAIAVHPESGHGVTANSHLNSSGGDPDEGVPEPPAQPSDETGHAVVGTTASGAATSASEDRISENDAAGGSLTRNGDGSDESDVESSAGTENPFTGVRIDVAGEEHAVGDSETELHNVARDEVSPDASGVVTDRVSGETGVVEPGHGSSSVTSGNSEEETGHAIVYPAENTETDPETSAGSNPSQAPVMPQIPGSRAAGTDVSSKVPENVTTPETVSIVPSTAMIDAAKSSKERSSEDVRKDELQKKIASRRGQTGFKGFCPVRLRDRRELVDSKPEFRSRFGLREYSFSDVAAREAFEAAPAKYAPAAGGSDVVLLVNSGEDQSGSLDYCLWYHDRLYLFRSKETMDLFSEDPSRYASQY